MLCHRKIMQGICCYLHEAYDFSVVSCSVRVVSRLMLHSYKCLCDNVLCGFSVV